MLTYLMSGLIECLDSHLLKNHVACSLWKTATLKRMTVKRQIIFGIRRKLDLTQEPPERVSGTPSHRIPRSHSESHYLNTL